MLISDWERLPGLLPAKGEKGKSNEYEMQKMVHERGSQADVCYETPSDTQALQYDTCALCTNIPQVINTYKVNISSN